jgi:hypothetical protein
MCGGFLDDMPNANSHSCYECRFYLITWDSQFPHGCRAHTFRGKKLPSLEVFDASGLECMLFARKKPRSTRIESEPIVDTATFSTSR